MPTQPEKILDNQMDELEGKSPEDLQTMLQKELSESGDKPPAESEGTKEETPPEEKQKADPAERLTVLEKQVQDQTSFINQRNAEIGLLRKQLRDLQKPAELDIPDEEFHADPKKATLKALHMAKQREAEEQEASARHQQETRAVYKSAIDQWSPDFEKKVPDLSEMMQRDKAPEQLVQQFRADPVATLNPAIIFQMLKRVEAEKKIAELEGKLKESSKQTAKTVSTIQNAGRAKPVTTSVAPSSQRSLDNLTEEDIESMSREELEKLYKTLK
jgi:hypothetical protein